MAWPKLLIHWANCLKLIPIHSVADLANGDFFALVLDFIDTQHQGISVFKRLELVLTGKYHPANWIDLRAAEKGDEDELLKVLAVIIAISSLSAEAEGERNIFRAKPSLSLSVDEQKTIKDFLVKVMNNNLVVSESFVPVDQENQIPATPLHKDSQGTVRKVLFPPQPLAPTVETNEMNWTSPSIYQSSPCSPRGNKKSPLQNLFQSPSMKQKLLFSQKLNEIQGLKLRLGNLEDERDDLEQELRQSKEDNVNLRESLDVYKKDNSALRTQLRKCTSAVPATPIVEPVVPPDDSRVHSLEEKLIRAKRAEERTETNLCNAKGRINELDEELKLAKAQIKEAYNEIKGLHEDYRLLQENFQEASQKLLEKEETILSLDQHCNELKKIVSAKQYLIREMEDSLEVKTCEFQEASRETDKLIVKLQRDLEALHSEMNDQKATTKSLQSQLKETNESRFCLENQVKEEKLRREALNAELQEAVQWKEKLELEVTELHGILNNCEQDLKSAKVRIEESREELRILHDDHRLLQEHFHSASQQLSEKEEAILNLEHLCNEQKKVVSAKESQIREIEDSLKVRTCEFQEASREKDKLIAKLRADLEDLNSTLADQKAAIEDLNSDLKETNDLRFCLEAQVQEEKLRGEILNAELQEAARLKEKLELQVTEVQEILTNCEDDLKSAKGRIEECSDELRILHEDHRLMQEHFHAASQQLSEKEKVILNLEHLCNEQKEVVSAKESQIREIEDSLKVRTCEFQEASREKDKIITTLGGDVQDLNTKLADQNAAMESLKSELKETNESRFCLENQAQEERLRAEVLNAELQEAVRLKEVLELQLTEVQGILTNCEQDLKSAKGQIEESREELRILHDDHQLMQERFHSASQQVTEREEVILNLEHLCNEQQKLVSSKESQIREIEDYLKLKTCEFQEASREKDKIIATLRGDLEDLNSKLVDLKATTEGLKSELKETNDSRLCFENQVQEEQLRGKALNAELQEAVQLKEVLELQVTELHGILTNCEQDLESAKGRIEQSREELRILHDDHQLMQERFHAASQQLSEKEEVILNLEHLCNEQKKVVAAKESQIREIEDSLKVKTCEFQEASREKDKLIVNLRGDLEDLNAKLADQKAAIERLLSQLKETNDFRFRLEVEVQEEKLRVETLNAELQEAARLKEALELQVTDVQGILTNCEEDLKSAQGRIEESREELRILHDDHRLMQERFHSASQQVTEREEVILNLEHLCNEQQKLVSSKESQIREIEDYLKLKTCEFQEASREKDKIIATLRGDLEDLNSKLVDLKATTEGLKSELKETNDSRLCFENQVQEEQLRGKALNAELQEAVQLKEVLELQVTELHGILTNCEQDLESAKGRIEQSREELRILHDDHQLMQERFHAASQQLSEKEEVILNLEHLCNEQKKVVAAKESQIREIEDSLKVKTCEFQEASREKDKLIVNLRGDLEDLNAKLADQKAAIERLLSQLKETNDFRFRLEVEVQEEKLRVETLNAELQEAARLKEALELQVTDVQGILTNCEEDLKSAQGRIEESREELRILHDDHRLMQERFHVASQQLSEKEKVILNLEHLCNEQKEVVSAKESQIREIEDSLKAKTCEFQEASREKDELIVNLRGDLEDLNSRLADQNAAMESLKSELKETNDSRFCLENQAEEEKLRAEVLNAELQEAVRLKEVLELQLTDVQGILTNREQDLKSAESRIEESREELRILQDDHRHMQERFRAASQQLSEREEVILNLEHLCNEQKKFVSAKESQICEIEDSLKVKTCEFQEASREKDKVIAKLHIDLEDLNSKLTGQNAAIEGLQSELKESNGSRFRLENQLREEKLRAEALNAELQEAVRLGGVLEMQVTEFNGILEDRVAEAERRTKKESLDKYKDRFNQVKSEMKEVMRTEVEARDQKLAVEKTKVSELAEQVEDLKRNAAQQRRANLDLHQKIFMLEQVEKAHQKLLADLNEKERNARPVRTQLSYETQPYTQSYHYQQEMPPSTQSFASSSFVPQYHSSTMGLSSSYVPAPTVTTDDNMFCMDMDSIRSRRLSTGSVVSNSSTNSRSKVVPDGSGSVFTCEDEDLLFTNTHLSSLLNGKPELPEDRISEIQRRNTLQPPHMRSCYPAEFQYIDPVNTAINEDSIRAPQVYSKSTSGPVGQKFIDNHSLNPSSGRAPLSPSASRINQGHIDPRSPGRGSLKYQRVKSDSVLTPTKAQRQQELRNSGLFRHPFAR